MQNKTSVLFSVAMVIALSLFASCDKEHVNTGDESEAESEAEGKGENPQLFDQCDPFHVGSRCIGADVIAVCRFGSDEYRLVHDSNCSDDMPLCYETTTSSSVNATCVCREGMRACSSGCQGVCDTSKGCDSEDGSPSCVAECQDVGSGPEYRSIEECNCSSSESGQASCTEGESEAEAEAEGESCEDPCECLTYETCTTNSDCRWWLGRCHTAGICYEIHSFAECTVVGCNWYGCPPPGSSNCPVVGDCGP
ncbi:MAG: hypothetical protein Q7S48_04025 [bacterium]|nr:hypothetical protein [bacterium]